MIDPQGQANKWIKNFETKELVIKKRCKLHEVSGMLFNLVPRFIRKSFGEMDPTLEPIYKKLC